MSGIQLFSHHQYAQHTTLHDELDADPIKQFQQWFKEAEAQHVQEPEAVCLSTVDPNTLIPSSRMVLLKQVDANGFCFYTNYSSRKGRELFPTPAREVHASLCFYWREVERSVRIVGKVEKMTREETTTYFHSRPLDSQLGAWASQQSAPLADRDTLHAAIEAKRQSLTDEERSTGHVAPPPYWGGVRIRPKEIEFWQGQPNRLHDRILYTAAPPNVRAKVDRNVAHTWSKQRLSP